MTRPFDWVTVEDGDAVVHPCVLPVGATVFGLSLPPSYREFVGRLGYGLYGGFLHLFPWAPGYGDDISLRAAELRMMFAGSLDLDIAELEPDGSPVALLASVPFGISINGDTLCWDPEHVHNGEPEVVVVAAKVLAFRRTGMGLEAFLRSLCGPEMAKTLLGSSSCGIPPSFRPSAFFDEWCRRGGTNSHV